MVRPVLTIAVLLAALVPASAPGAGVPSVSDVHIAYGDACVNHATAVLNDAEHGPPAASAGSTHEITPEITRTGAASGAVWITGQNYDSVARVAANGRVSVHQLPRRPNAPCLGPHGIEFDRGGKLWVSLEFAGAIAQLDSGGAIVKSYDVRYFCKGCGGGANARTWINPHPHGMTIAHDGKTIWYTGKATGSVGKITLANGRVETFALPTLGGVPIYVKEDRHGIMWVTELVGNRIARVAPSGAVNEYSIPTPNSRPIAIVPGPDDAMWFSEEAGSKVGRIDANGTITELDIPPPASPSTNRYILAGLAFDTSGNLWTQQYVDPNAPGPAPSGRPCANACDYIVEIDKATLATHAPGTPLAVTRYQVPTAGTVMHRIIAGLDGTMWFTELKTNRVGEYTPAHPPASR